MRSLDEYVKGSGILILLSFFLHLEWVWRVYL